MPQGKHVTSWCKAGSRRLFWPAWLISPVQRWRLQLLWLVLLSIPLLLSASQPLSPEDMKLVKRAEETYGPRAGKRVTSWRTLAMQNKAAGLTDRQKLEKVNQFLKQMTTLINLNLLMILSQQECTSRLTKLLLK